MNRFITNINDGFNFSSALIDMIQKDGDHLILAYGYITNADAVKDIFKEVDKFLTKSKRNRVSVYVGVLGGRGAAIDTVNLRLDDLITESFLNKSMSNKFNIYGIENFHAKFGVMLRRNIPMSGLMGSSNLSNPALNNNNRCELDLYMEGGKENNLLIDFWEVNVAVLKDLPRERFRLLQLNVNREIEILKVDDILNSIKKEEGYLRKIYSDSASSIEEGFALYESDRDQGVFYEDPDSK